MTRKNESAIKSKISPVSVILFIVLVIYVAVLIGLLLWGVLTSFKGKIEFKHNPYGFPEKWELNIVKVMNNFKLNLEDSRGVTRDVGLPMMFLYSVLYALGCSLAFTLVQAVTAYAASRFNFMFSKVLYGIVIVTMIVPLVGTLPSELELCVKLGLYNKIYGLWIMRANFLGIYFLIFYNLFRGLPMSFTEAAKIDGASNLMIMTKIIFPLSLNTIGTVLLINFITFWNDYQTPLLYMPGYPTVSYGLYSITIAGTSTAELQNTPCRLATAVIVIIPILAIFFVFQKRLLGNLTVGGVKG